MTSEIGENAVLIVEDEAEGDNIKPLRNLSISLQSDEFGTVGNNTEYLSIKILWIYLSSYQYNTFDTHLFDKFILFISHLQNCGTL